MVVVPTEPARRRAERRPRPSRITKDAKNATDQYFLKKKKKTLCYFCRPLPESTPVMPYISIYHRWDTCPGDAWKAMQKYYFSKRREEEKSTVWLAYCFYFNKSFCMSESKCLG
jgi:hypothetical protein